MISIQPSRLRQVVLASILPAIIFIAPTAMADKVIIDGPNGGDCTDIGSWDVEEKCCTLTQDVLNESIRLQSSNIKLDGGNFSLRGNGAAIGVFVPGRKNIEITRLTIEQFQLGIVLAAAHDAKLRYVAIKDTSRLQPAGGGGGIVLNSSNNVVIDEFTIENSAETAIIVSKSKNAAVANGTFKENSMGIQISRSPDGNYSNLDFAGSQRNPGTPIILEQSNENTFDYITISSYPNSHGVEIDRHSKGNLFFFNEVESTRLHGLLVKGTGNTFICNTLSGHGGQAIAVQGQLARNNRFAFNNLLGNDNAVDRNRRNAFQGNYWEMDAPCMNANGDGFCDVPHGFIGNLDPLPSAAVVQWRENPSLCIGAMLESEYDEED